MKQNLSSIFGLPWGWFNIGILPRSNEPPIVCTHSTGGGAGPGQLRGTELCDGRGPGSFSGHRGTKEKG